MTSGPRPSASMPVSSEAAMKPAEPNARAWPNRFRLEPSAWMVQASIGAGQPATPAAEIAIATPNRGTTGASHSHAATPIMRKPASTMDGRTSPRRSARMPQSGAARIIAPPGIALSRPRVARSTPMAVK